ncbi:ABC transporter ATP-binding protein [Nonomuraea africana]|uniref:Oligopeptide/dipeptide ABC transporter ATP-binding protein n=1 Tax=Nonomuraea africana TaxID=46171 RepID=A0ABR9KB67_9ACTN|nr:ABC transporter ATP-binding protein [Nonomuraea africana]MBE1559264.1 oligopeptide/dipeptide ABC transporter ATP-binding protein [Nonomuraea africana]
MLEIDELSVRLPHTARPAIDGISLTVAENETVGLVGESGSGKSLTARAVLGLLPAAALTAGRILMDGADVLRMSPAALRRHRTHGAAMIYQDPRAAISPFRRIGDFLTEILREELGARAARARAVELLGLVGLPEPERHVRQHPHELSGGMLQRVVIAAALAGEPRLVLADEPTTALDVTTQAEIIRLLRDLRARTAAGMLFITHDLELAAMICDRVYVMYAGRIMETGPTRRLFADPRHPYTSGLLAATPRVSDLGALPPAIPGRPPDLLTALPGCPFAPRCAHVTESCTAAAPSLADGVACVKAGS